MLKTKEFSLVRVANNTLSESVSKVRTAAKCDVVTARHLYYIGEAHKENKSPNHLKKILNLLEINNTEEVEKALAEKTEERIKVTVSVKPVTCAEMRHQYLVAFSANYPGFHKDCDEKLKALGFELLEVRFTGNSYPSYVLVADKEYDNVAQCFYVCNDKGDLLFYFYNYRNTRTRLSNGKWMYHYNTSAYSMPSVKESYLEVLLKTLNS